MDYEFLSHGNCTHACRTETAITQPPFSFTSWVMVSAIKTVHFLRNHLLNYVASGSFQDHVKRFSCSSLQGNQGWLAVTKVQKSLDTAVYYQVLQITLY